MSRKSKKASAVQRAVGQGKPGQEKSNKHITKITAKPANTPENTAKTSDRPDTAIKAETTANRSEKASDAKTMSKSPTKPATQAAKSATKADKTAAKRAKKSKTERVEKPLKEIFLLARPFVALGRYIRDSWREIRRVRWPNRKATWKMTGAVLAYCIVFMAFIVLLDSFFTWFFSLIIKYPRN